MIKRYILLISQPVDQHLQLNEMQIYEIVNKKLPCALAQGSFYIFLTDFLALAGAMINVSVNAGKRESRSA
jgi:hypothetical protein